MKINFMELLFKSITGVGTVTGGSSNMARRKVTLHKNIAPEKSTILSKRMIATTVMEL